MAGFLARERVLQIRRPFSDSGENLLAAKQRGKSVTGVYMMSFNYSEFSQLSALGLLVSCSASRSSVAVAVTLGPNAVLFSPIDPRHLHCHKAHSLCTQLNSSSFLHCFFLGAKRRISYYCYW